MPDAGSVAGARSKIWTVAWREFKHTVLTKAFLFAVIGFPILMAAIGGLAGVIIAGHKEPPLKGTLAIVCSTTEVADAARALFDPAEQQRQRDAAIEAGKDMATELTGIEPPAGAMGSTELRAAFGTVDVEIAVEEHSEDADVESLRERVDAGDLVAVAVVPADVIEVPDPSVADRDRPRFQLYVDEDRDSDHVGVLERQIGRAIVRTRLRRANLEPETAMAMIDRPRSETTRILAGGESKQESEGARELSRLIPMAFMFLIWIATFSTGQHLLMSTIEEKSNKVMEVLLSAVSPLQLMTGKILGQALAGLIIVVMYSGVGMIGLIAASSMHLIPPIQLVYLFVYFIMAYFMVASIMASVGSAVSDVREANSLMTPVMLILMLPIMLWLPISQAPNGGLATAFSFLPPAIPFVMILRATADEGVPLWQIPVTMIWGFLCVFVMIWMGSRIFRVGVLMQGKPPSPLQLIKWIRYK